MHYRALGKTGLEVSAIGFGGWAIAGNAAGDSYGPTDDAESLAALNLAYELGCTLFDTAARFGNGHGETLLGQALKGWERERVIIATKGGQDFSGDVVKASFSEASLRQGVEDSLRRLQIEAIDCFHLHTPPLALIQDGRVFEVLQSMKQEGKIRFVGVAIHDPQEGIQAIQHGGIDTVQAVWNWFDRRAEKQLMDVCAETQTGLMLREPLAHGFLGGQFTEGMTFAEGDHRAIWPRPFASRRILAAGQFAALAPGGLSGLASLAINSALSVHPAVSSVLVGCKTPAQVEANLAVADQPPIDAALRAETERVYSGIFGAF